MRIDRDLRPDATRGRKGRGVLIGCAIYLVSVTLGLVVGVLVFGWMLERAERAGGLDLAGIYFILGFLWGGVLGLILGTFLARIATRWRQSPDVGSAVALVLWMGFWWLAALWLGVLHDGCLAETCHQFVDDARRVLLILETGALVLSVVAVVALRSAPQRWLAFGLGAVVSPVLIFGALPLVPPTGRAPAPPEILGNVEIRFVAANNRAELPGTLSKLELGFKPVNSEVIHVFDITGSDGAFRLTPLPGGYQFAHLSLKAAGLGRKPVLLSVKGPSFEVPDRGCVYLGRIAFSFVLLPPGDTNAQARALIEYIERTGGDPTQSVSWEEVAGRSIYTPHGGVGAVDLPPPKARTPGWEECTIQLART